MGGSRIYLITAFIILIPMANSNSGVTGSLQLLIAAAVGLIGMFLILQEGGGPVMNNGILLVLLSAGGFAYLLMRGR